MSIDNNTYLRERDRMKKFNKLSSSISAKDIGMMIDSHNKGVEDKKDRDYSKDINDRNDYFWKLWVRQAKELMGVKHTKDTFFISKNTIARSPNSLI